MARSLRQTAYVINPVSLEKEQTLACSNILSTILLFLKTFLSFVPSLKQLNLEFLRFPTRKITSKYNNPEERV
jgi:hypothetical protein